MGKVIKIERARERRTEALIAGFREAMAEAGGSFEQQEAVALSLANELVRDWTAEALHAIERNFGDEVVVAGERYRRGSEGTIRYHTLCGPVAIRRAVYRQVGVHNGPTVVPLDLRAGLWENATPALAFSVTQGFASQPLRHYEAEMAAAHRCVPSRSTLERIGKRIGAAIETGLEETEPRIRAAEPFVEGVHSISIGLDRTTVPMAEVIPGAPIPEPRIRRRPAPVSVNYRMAYVGTVSLHDEDGEVLSTKRFGATGQEGPDDIVERIGRELNHQRARYDAPISVIQDGAPELWTLIAAMSERHQIPIADEVIDRYHVDERLARICEFVFGGYAGTEELYELWRHELDHSDTAIERIIKHLDALVWHSRFGVIDDDPAPTFWTARDVHTIRGEALVGIEGHLEYLRRNRRRIRYASRRRAGLPIGSGATEGACKSVVTVRFKRSGQRWFESGVAPCLSLRALHLSERLRPAFVRSSRARTARLDAA
jgi:hypothetical protein